MTKPKIPGPVPFDKRKNVQLNVRCIKSFTSLHTQRVVCSVPQQAFAKKYNNKLSETLKRKTPTASDKCSSLNSESFQHEKNELMQDVDTDITLTMPEFLSTKRAREDSGSEYDYLLDGSNQSSQINFEEEYMGSTDTDNDTDSISSVSKILNKEKEEVVQFLNICEEGDETDSEDEEETSDSEKKEENGKKIVAAREWKKKVMNRLSMKAKGFGLDSKFAIFTFNDPRRLVPIASFLLEYTIVIDVESMSIIYVSEIKYRKTNALSSDMKWPLFDINLTPLITILQSFQRTEDMDTDEMSVSKQKKKKRNLKATVFGLLKRDRGANMRASLTYQIIKSGNRLGKTNIACFENDIFCVLSNWDFFCYVIYKNIDVFADPAREAQKDFVKDLVSSFYKSHVLFFMSELNPSRKVPDIGSDRFSLVYQTDSSFRPSMNVKEFIQKSNAFFTEASEEFKLREDDEMQDETAAEPCISWEAAAEVSQKERMSMINNLIKRHGLRRDMATSRAKVAERAKKLKGVQNATPKEIKTQFDMIYMYRPLLGSIRDTKTLYMVVRIFETMVNMFNHHHVVRKNLNDLIKTLFNDSVKPSSVMPMIGNLDIFSVSPGKDESVSIVLKSVQVKCNWLFEWVKNTLALEFTENVFNYTGDDEKFAIIMENKVREYLEENNLRIWNADFLLAHADRNDVTSKNIPSFHSVKNNRNFFRAILLPMFGDYSAYAFFMLFTQKMCTAVQTRSNNTMKPVFLSPCPTHDMVIEMKLILNLPGFVPYCKCNMCKNTQELKQNEVMMFILFNVDSWTLRQWYNVIRRVGNSICFILSSGVHAHNQFITDFILKKLPRVIYSQQHISCASHLVFPFKLRQFSNAFTDLSKVYETGTNCKNLKDAYQEFLWNRQSLTFHENVSDIAEGVFHGTYDPQLMRLFLGVQNMVLPTHFDKLSLQLFVLNSGDAYDFHSQLDALRGGMVCPGDLFRVVDCDSNNVCSSSESGVRLVAEVLSENCMISSRVLRTNSPPEFYQKQQNHADKNVLEYNLRSDLKPEMKNDLPPLETMSRTSILEHPNGMYSNLDKVWVKMVGCSATNETTLEIKCNHKINDHQYCCNLKDVGYTSARSPFHYVNLGVHSKEYVRATAIHPRFYTRQQVKFAMVYISQKTKETMKTSKAWIPAMNRIIRMATHSVLVYGCSKEFLLDCYRENLK